LLEASSSSNSAPLDQLKCVICYPLSPIVGKKKGTINYKFANEIFILKKHLDNNYKQLWNEWNEQEKDGHEVNRQATKKRFGPTLLINFCKFFDNCVPYNKNNL
jgi:hypothetical protein